MSRARSHKLGIIGGDGIGPEVTDAALLVLDAAEARFGFHTERERLDWGSERYLATKQRTAAVDIAGLRRFDAVLLGAIGHPDAPRGLIERDIIIGIRRGLDLFVNLRPLVLYDERLCPLKDRRVEDVDIVVVRENTEDVYANAETGVVEGAGTPDETARVEMRFTRRGIERITRYAYELARARPRKRLTLVDKSNAIPIQELWRTVLDEIGREFPDVEHDAVYVDAACMWLVQRPERFDVIVTTNLFGDIITDLGAAICGGLGIGASGNIRPGAVSVFEPIHGSAPKYTGQHVASPVGSIAALALLLDHVGEGDAARAVDGAIRRAFREGIVKSVEAGSGDTFVIARAIAGLI